MRDQKKILYKNSLIIETRKIGEIVEKNYIYSYHKKCSEIYKRLLKWSRFSKLNESINKFELKQINQSSDGKLNILIHQKYCNKINHKRGISVLKFLKNLEIDLLEAWNLGLVHGDLNRKNILLTEEGYRIIDIEPILKVCTDNNKFVLRTTYPYLARVDKKNWNVTIASDKLGFKCFSSWVNKKVEHPSQEKYL